MPAIPLPVPPIPLPSRTLRSAVSLVRRQQESTSFVAIPSSYGDLNNSLAPGVIAGIVIGSVAGFLLLLYVIYAILHGGPVLIPVRGEKSTRAPSTLGTSTLGTSTLGPSTLGPSTYGSRSAVSFRSRREEKNKRRRSSAHSSRRPRSRTAEVVEVRRQSRTATRKLNRAEPMIVDPPRSPSPVSTAPPRAVPASEVSALSSLDEIIVEEERTPPRRRSSSRRYSPERGYRRDSYYRDGLDSERYHSQRDSPGRGSSGRRY